MWTEGCQEAYEQLQQVLINEPVVKNSDFSTDFSLQTDTSDCGVGTMLSQLDEKGTDHPVVYFSRRLTSREQKYTTIQKQCLAIQLSV